MSHFIEPGSFGNEKPPEQATAAQSRLQTFEELGLADHFRTAVEEELTAGEKVVWLGRPSRNPEVFPPTPIMMLTVIGSVVLVVAIVLALFVVRGLALFFPGFLGLFGLLFILAPRYLKFNPVHSYQACYVVTNRRAILIERGMMQLPFRKSYLPHELLGLECQINERVKDAGDLIFEYFFAASNTLNTPGAMNQVQQVGKRTPRGFFFLDQAREVEQIIRTTLLGNLEKAMDGHDAAAPSAPPPLPGAKLPPRPVSMSAPEAGTDAPAQAGDYREDGQVPEELKQKVLAELGPNERLVWLAQPVGALVFRRSLGYFAGAGLSVALALFVVLMFMAKPVTVAPPVGNPPPVGKNAPKQKVQPPAPVVQPAPSISAGALVGPAVLMLVSICLALVPIYRWKMAQGSCYALTNRRALVFKQGLFGPTRESYSPLEVSAMRRSDSWLFAQGGDLIFRSVTVVSTSYNQRGGSSSSARTTHYGFLAIAHIGEVEKLVRATLIDRFVDKLQEAGSF